MIDPGHGGEDPGAIGGSGNYEKHVTLAISRKLAEHFRKHPGFRAYLTRDGDYFIPLQDRRKIARNRYKADIFISIHADSAPSPLAKGASVFALSRKGANTASSRFAAALADRENKADQIGGVFMPESRDSLLASVLADMVVEGSLTHSLQMGSAILGRLDDLGHLHSKRVEQAGFAVLKEPGMISVLVETGFISNPDEERKLTNPDHQQEIARSVYHGVKAYLEKYPLNGSHFAWGKERRSGKVRRQALEAVAPPRPVVVSRPEKLIDKPVEPAVKPTIPVEPATVARAEDPARLMALPVAPEPKPQPAVVTEPAPVKTLPKASLPMSLEEFAGESAASAKARTESTRDKPALVKPAPVRPAVKAESKPVVKPEAKPEPRRPAKPTQHTVSSGDSLSAIADRYGLTLESLKAWNGLKADTAVLGTTLRLTPPESTKADKADKADKAKADQKPSKTDKTDKKTAVRTHTVKPGDSLSAIAVQYGVSAQAIRDANRMKDDNVQLGKTLTIPTP